MQRKTINLTFQEFTASLNNTTPPSNLSILLQALWHERKGEWEMAHTLAQDVNSKEGSWIHAYLHRVEGDTGNAAYWYQRAARPIAKGNVKDEWDEIVKELLARPM